MEVTVGSLFSGIGGLDLGLERAGMKVIWQSEIDKYCCKILKKHWPEVPNHGNIKEINWQEIQKPNIIAGGYPCQPFSQAGKRKGTQDPRHLWPWVREAISQLRPDYAILENVPGHLTLGGTEVIGALTEIGYDAEWRVVSAAGLGANHVRKRIIIVAYPSSKHSNGGDDHSKIGMECKTVPQFRNSCRSQNVAHTEGCVSYGNIHGDIETSAANNQVCEWRKEAYLFKTGGTNGFDNKGHWQIEPNVGRVADGIPNRVDRLRGLGNAVVPQVAEYIGRLVMEQYN
jgi:DNA (cytosine-5)-methyltransferase 1